MKIAIIGTGDVGCALGKGLVGKHEVIYGSREPAGTKGKVPADVEVKSQKEAAAQGEVVFLAVPYRIVKEIVGSLEKELIGKVVVDVTNVVDEKWDLALGFSTSGAEELAKLLPETKVVKAFNTVFAQNMINGKTCGEQLTLFVAGNDQKAKEIVMQIGRDIGFEPVDGGPLKYARHLEPLGILLIKLGYELNLGFGIGFRLVHD